MTSGTRSFKTQVSFILRWFLKLKLQAQWNDDILRVGVKLLSASYARVSTKRVPLSVKSELFYIV